MNTFLTWLKVIPSILQAVIAAVAALETGFQEVATATGASAAGAGAVKLGIVQAAIQSLYATEQSLVSVIPLDKLTAYVTSIASALVAAFNKLGWFQKASSTASTATAA
jgi:hypothetical protein